VIDVLPVRTPTVPPATHTNCYRVGRFVVDPASPWADEQARLATWAPDIAGILVTHAHEDHIGGVADLAARTSARVYAHADVVVPFPVDVRLSDGDVIDTGGGRLRALHTPGHARGHLCFRLEESGEILAGDMVAGIGTIVLVEPDGHLGDYLASLARLAALGGALHPAHGPVIPDGPGLIAQYLAHRHARTEQVYGALVDGPLDPGGIAARVYAGIPGVHMGLATAQVRTHLSWLLERGRVRRHGEIWERS
jgi:glyoxylase-like metal-dependent hydrolase (beta-lactamase superfamily II)